MPLGCISTRNGDKDKVIRLSLPRRKRCIPSRAGNAGSTPVRELLRHSQLFPDQSLRASFACVSVSISVVGSRFNAMADPVVEPQGALVGLQGCLRLLVAC